MNIYDLMYKSPRIGSSSLDNHTIISGTSLIVSTISTIFAFSIGMAYWGGDPQSVRFVDNYFLLFLAFGFPGLLWCGSFFLMLVDEGIEWSIKFITRDRYTVGNFLIYKLATNSIAAQGNRLGAWSIANAHGLLGIVLGVVFLLIHCTFYSSFWISASALIILLLSGLFFGGLFLGRFVFDIHMKLKDHQNDSNAHK